MFKNTPNWIKTNYEYDAKRAFVKSFKLYNLRHIFMNQNYLNISCLRP